MEVRRRAARPRGRRVAGAGPARRAPEEDLSRGTLPDPAFSSAWRLRAGRRAALRLCRLQQRWEQAIGQIVQGPAQLLDTLNPRRVGPDGFQVVGHALDG